MEANSNQLEDIQDPDFFNKIKAAIEDDLSNIKKMVDGISQMRVEAAYLESDLMMTIDCATWEHITELIGLASMKKTIDNDIN